MKQEFFSLRFNSNNVELFVEIIGEYNANELLTGESDLNQVNVKKSQGRKAYDIVRLQDVFNFLISAELKRDLELENLKGWSTYGITSDDFDETYSGFLCLGKCGKPNRPKQTGFIKGYSFDIKTWDGNDFFIPETTLQIICTERAKNVILKRNIKNIDLTNIEDLEWYNA